MYYIYNNVDAMSYHRGHYPVSFLGAIGSRGRVRRPHTRTHTIFRHGLVVHFKTLSVKFYAFVFYSNSKPWKLHCKKLYINVRVQAATLTYLVDTTTGGHREEEEGEVNGHAVSCVCSYVAKLTVHTVFPLLAPVFFTRVFLPERVMRLCTVSTRYSDPIEISETKE